MTRKLLTDLHNKAFFLPVKLAAINPNYIELSSGNTSHSSQSNEYKRTQHDTDLVRGSHLGLVLSCCCKSWICKRLVFKYCNANTFFQPVWARFFQHVFMCCIAHMYIIAHLELPVCLESKRRPLSWSPPSKRCRLSTCIWRAGDLLSLSIAEIAANQLTPWLHVSLDIAFLLGTRTRFK